jgi:outer membrane immunogenic protein
MKKLILAGTALLTGTVVALPASAEVFNGLYIGAQAGYDKNAVHVDGSGVHINNKSDLAYGVMAGLDLKVSPNIVAGVEADMSLNSNDFNFSDGTTIIDGKAKRTFSLTGRLGYLLADRILFYGRAGYANQSFRFSDSLNTSKHNFDGFKYGGGVEVGLLPNLGVRLEYTRTNYNSGSAPITSTATTFSPDTSRVMLGASLYF